MYACVHACVYACVSVCVCGGGGGGVCVRARNICVCVGVYVLVCVRMPFLQRPSIEHSHTLYPCITKLCWAADKEWCS